MIFSLEKLGVLPKIRPFGDPEAYPKEKENGLLGMIWMIFAFGFLQIPSGLR